MLSISVPGDTGRQGTRAGYVASDPIGKHWIACNRI